MISLGTSNERGFTLLEILVAMAVFAIASLGILSMSVTTVRGNAFTRYAAEAREVTQGKLEELLATQPITLLGGGEDRVFGDGRPDGPYRRTWTVAAGPTANTVQVTVTTTWQEKGEGKQVVLEALAGGEVP